MINLHPIFVHFPIALLVVYGILEFIRSKKITSQPYWFHIKASFVIIGTLGGFVALETGDMAEGLFRSQRALVEVHSTWAAASIIFFGMIAAAYAITWIRQDWHITSFSNRWVNLVWLIFDGAAKLIFRPYILFLLIAVGLVSLTVTGALGGVIAQGPNVDPVAHWIYNLVY